MIRIDDILGFLVADTLTPSTMGAQLERLKFGLISTPDPFQAREDAEARILENAELLRAVDEFRAVPEFYPTSSRSTKYKTLEKIQKGTTPRRTQGEIALNVLRSYQKWGTKSPEQALVTVYSYVRSIAPRVVPTLDTDTVKATQMFREGKARRSRDLAISAYADSLLALGSFLTKRAKCRP